MYPVIFQDPVMYDKLLPVRKSIEELLSPAANNFYLREFEFFKVVVNLLYLEVHLLYVLAHLFYIVVHLLYVIVHLLR